MTAATARDLLSRRYDSPGMAFVTRRFSQPLGGALAAIALVCGLSPNAVTLIGFLTAVAGSVAFGADTSIASLVTAAALWQLAFALDCADGQLARATSRQSPFGGWLDVACDFGRTVSVSLAILASLLHRGEVWNAAAYVAAFSLMTGSAVYLFTAINTTVRSAPELALTGWKHQIRQLIRAATDTPVTLLALCAMRPWPTILFIASTGLGCMLIMRAVGIANARLRTKQAPRAT